VPIFLSAIVFLQFVNQKVARTWATFNSAAPMHFMERLAELFEGSDSGETGEMEGGAWLRNDSLPRFA
jgi:hypothetical protein